jgi:adenylosuccinate lyase
MKRNIQTAALVTFPNSGHLINLEEPAMFNRVVLDLCRDVWTYISLGYFRQRAVAGETGSSTMPHKVNPVEFENAEANLGISNALLNHLAQKLPVSRLQRDLSDSSAIRSYGVAIAHSYLALQSAQSGLNKIELDRETLLAELADSWELLGEAVQTVLRKHQIADAYEKLKSLTRAKRVTATMLHEFISSLPIPPADKDRLLQLTPATYVGIAEKLALTAIDLEDQLS